MTTASAPDAVVSMMATGATTDTAGSGWTLIKSAGFLLTQVQFPTTTGTFIVSMGAGSGTYGGSLFVDRCGSLVKHTLVQYQVGPSGSYTGATGGGFTAGYIADAIH
jgi:hypothetical protein